MLHIKETIVVEGKFDKEKLKKITDAPIICTGGFNLYSNKETIRAIRNMAKKTGIIILTDSDRAGFRIRNYIKQCVGENGVVRHAYIPAVEGKERRKEKSSKEGILGVEGMTEEMLSQILKSVTDVKLDEGLTQSGPKITKAILFEDGLAGKPDSFEKRKKLAGILGLPTRISANALVDVLNKVYGYNEYKIAIKKLQKN